MEGETSTTHREHFGDRKLPDISRKITACVVCRKQKIKCHMQNGVPPCSRCKRRGISCTVNKSLHSLLESDVDWKNAVIQRLKNLETAMGKVADATSLNEIHDLIAHAATPLPAGSMAEDVNSTLSPQEGSEERPWEIDMDAVGGPAAIPASHLIERVPNSATFPAKEKPGKHDIVTQGILTTDRAMELFNLYHDGFDHFVYRILGEDRTFESVRSSSPLLLLAICSVSALQSASADFEKCYRAFLQACSSRAFSKACSVEDVQAYCIGAFWLSDMSWNLVGAAVRAATQLQLHLNIYKALEGDRESYLRARLFYLVYICDHHFSILYGRLPMTGSNSDAINAWRRFARSKHACEDDARLASQVQVWNIYSRMQDRFGINVEVLLPAEALPEVRGFVAELDKYRAEWNESYSPNEHIGNYPNKGLGLHHHFAKLYACSHVFRGRAIVEPGIIPELDEIVNIAVISAKSILTSLVADNEIQSYLKGLPSYFFTMITFASVFLLKLAQLYPNVPFTNKPEIFELVRRVVQTMRVVCATMHEKHLLTSIVHGLEKILSLTPGTNSQLQPTEQNGTSNTSGSTEILPQEEVSWLTNPLDVSFWENLDFLSVQNFPTDFDLDMNFRV